MQRPTLLYLKVLLKSFSLIHAITSIFTAYFRDKVSFAIWFCMEWEEIDGVKVFNFEDTLIRKSC
jgi:hypothetical protein